MAGRKIRDTEWSQEGSPVNTESACVYFSQALCNMPQSKEDGETKDFFTTE